MTHVRYWAVTLMAATAAGLAVDHYAFASSRGVFIAHGVAIAAGVRSVAGAAIAFVECAELDGCDFVPFDPTVDYPEYVDGRPHADGVRSFLSELLKVRA
jgi:hypothetical protein